MIWFYHAKKQELKDCWKNDILINYFEGEVAPRALPQTMLLPAVQERLNIPVLEHTEYEQYICNWC